MSLAPGTRRFDLDWLRVIAFGLLIYFHTAVAFLPSGLPMIINSEPSIALNLMVSFLHEFRLALLFLISGVGVFFALRRRDRQQFFAERTRRLVVPLLFGILVLVPPMVFFEKRFLGEFHANFLSFYPQFFTHGVYPEGNLSWHHYWFIAYLYLFCLAGWPVFRYLHSSAGQERISGWVHKLQSGAGIFLPIIPLLLFEVPLRALFPGFRDLINDWASFVQWFLVFLLGFVFAKYPVLLDRAQQQCWLSLAVALGCTVIMFSQYWQLGEGFTPVHNGQVTLLEYLAFCLVRITNLWCWLLVCLGLAGRYLQRSGPVLAYLNDAVYPLFCVHLTIIVALDYWVIPLDWSIAVKYTVITSAAVALSLLCYELIRRVSFLRGFFGLKPLQKA